MSRIGKKPIDIPSGVEVTLAEEAIVVKGKLGQLSVPSNADVSVEVVDGKVVVAPKSKIDSSNRAVWGLVRSLLANTLKGVTDGFSKTLEVNGVGYRAAVKGNLLNLVLGFSHDINYAIPEGIQVKCPKPTIIEIFGIDNQRVGQVAAEIRAFRPPEPYKGKGIKYSDEKIRRKEGKKK